MDQDKQMIAALTRENGDLKTRLHLAQAFGQILNKAYDALLHYGVNFKSLRTWSLWERFSEHHESPVVGDTDKRERLYEWLTRVGRDIDAAVRRKQHIKEVKD